MIALSAFQRFVFEPQAVEFRYNQGLWQSRESLQVN
jgi:hypothetical protein